MKVFFEKFKYFIIIILFLTIVFISYTNYLSTRNMIKDKYRHQKEIIEKSILHNIVYISDSYRIAEQQLNKEMKKYLMIMKNKYRQNQDVMGWDLEELKQKFTYYDIYIIDSNLKVIRATFEDDLGFDFSKFAGFSQILRKRLEGNSFAVDRLDLSTKGGKFKKYSYLPTHDNQYLLELSIEVQKRFPSLKSLDIFGDATKLTEEYEMVDEIALFSVEPLKHGVAKLKGSKGLDPNISETERELARNSVINNKVQSRIIYLDDNNYLYKFFPALLSGDGDKEQWNSYVVGIKYNAQVIIDEINKHRNLFLINTLVMILFFVLFILVVIYLLKKFEYQATHDQLTGLVNRKYFTKEFNNLILVNQKNRDKLAILFLDIDKFKGINDNFGHNTGDKILKEIAKKLKDIFAKDDIICRLGGDEFVITLSGISSKEEIIKKVDKLIESFNKPLTVDESKFFISFSLGISIYPEDARELEELIKKADYAMYIAKRRQQDYSLYSKSLQ